MHGIIFKQLFQFVRENHGQKALKEILYGCGLGMKYYDPTQAYPDHEVEQILDAVCKMLGVSRDSVLEAFGQYITPSLYKRFSAFIREEWDAMDLIENIEVMIYGSVKTTQNNVASPTLIINRKGKDEITISYTSKRDALAFGIGIVRAIGKHYNTKLTIKRSGATGNEVLTIKRVRNTTPVLS
ncbi:hypothetical protein FNH22_07530 [Fulvivirga sp. M361]|uniref:heme NO-binding domain-containing protein n=1 Tax=Fulvivirga sp. M361 TaxID=2594266 RepID=UPI00117B7D79|nr:heme NO-binding domain-containing protein [Fulvivirga sp. M361]TRX59896.1 hypothetical protein FNH22_07530 [Fulvivirga sp. M361]